MSGALAAGDLLAVTRFPSLDPGKHKQTNKQMQKTKVGSA